MEKNINHNYIPVTNIDWSTEKINRAGAIPFTVEDGKVWICFGISSYNSCITSFGGQFEIVDHDLLSTVVREFNEEVGNNFPHIVYTDLLTSYAVYSEHHVAVLLYVPKRIEKFRSTSEISDVIWVTPEQLDSMYKWRFFKLEYKTSIYDTEPYAYLFSGDLSNYLPSVINYFENPPPPIDSVVIPDRPKKLYDPHNIKYIEDYQVLLQNIPLTPFWTNSTIIVYNDKAAITDRDNVCYIFPKNNLSDFLGKLNQHQSVIGKKINLYTLDAKFLFPTTGKWVNIRKIRHPNTTPYKDIFDKIQRCIEAEQLKYERYKKKGLYFNEKRWEFLLVLKLMNIYQPKTRLEALKIIDNIKAKQEILNVLSHTDVYHLN